MGEGSTSQDPSRSLDLRRLRLWVVFFRRQYLPLPGRASLDCIIGDTHMEIVDSRARQARINCKPFHLAMLLLAFFTLSSCSPTLPKVCGIYVLKGGKCVELPRVSFEEAKYNVHQHMMGSDFNVKRFLKRENFVPVDKDAFNKEGFLVVSDPEWSGFQLVRVPCTGKWKDNEAAKEIVLAVGQSGPMGLPFNNSYLDPPVEPVPVEIKRVAVGDQSTTFSYIPAKPLDKGLYLIGHKKNNQPMDNVFAIAVE
jgi:hypothetical protein